MAKVAGAVVVALVLAGCASSQFGGGSTVPAIDMTGRWILAAPNAPTCGMNFVGAPGARTGTVTPEGGCPEKFYLSRRWGFEQDALVINDDEDNQLAQFNLAGTRFEGKTTGGTPVTLTRSTPAG